MTKRAKARLLKHMKGLSEAPLASTVGKQRMVERKVRVERALAKELQGPRRHRFKGGRAIQIQLWLTAVAMNVKKVVQSMATARAAPAAYFLFRLCAGRHATGLRCSVAALRIGLRQQFHEIV